MPHLLVKYAALSQNFTRRQRLARSILVSNMIGFMQEQQWRFEVFQSGNIADTSVNALHKRVLYQGRTLCLLGFSVMVAGHSSSYRRKAVASTVQQVELECQTSKDQAFLDRRDLLQRSERRALLHTLTEIGQNDFLAASAYAFCVDHMDLLCCNDPVTGQKQLDAAVMESTFELYQVMCGGKDGVGTVSKTTFERTLVRAMGDYDFKVRENKTVSKCETCKWLFFWKENYWSHAGILLYQLLKTVKREHKPQIIELMSTHRDFIRECRAGYHRRRALAMSGVVPSMGSICIDGKFFISVSMPRQTVTHSRAHRHGSKKDLHPIRLG